MQLPWVKDKFQGIPWEWPVGASYFPAGEAAILITFHHWDEVHLALHLKSFFWLTLSEGSVHSLLAPWQEWHGGRVW